LQHPAKPGNGLPIDPARRARQRGTTATGAQQIAVLSHEVQWHRDVFVTY